MTLPSYREVETLPHIRLVAARVGDFVGDWVGRSLEWSVCLPLERRVPVGSLAKVFSDEGEGLGRYTCACRECERGFNLRTPRAAGR